MINKILVTGNLGQLGSFLCEDLIRDGKNVIGLDSGVNKSKKVPKAIEKITIKGDIYNEDTVNEIINDTDAVIHCAAQISVEKSLIDPIHDLQTNVIGTVNLLQAADRSSSVKRFIYISSAAVYGNPIKLPIDENHPQNPLSVYGLSKVTAEKYVNMFGQIRNLPIVIIRPFNFYSERADPKSPYSGVITKFIGRVKENKNPIIEGDGKQTRDFIHVRDVVEMIRLTLKNNDAVGEVFNCGWGKAISINQLAEIIINNSGKNVKPIYTKERKGDIKHSYADINKAKKLLNFNPKIKLGDGLKEIIEI